MDIGSMLKTSWESFKANIGMAIGLYLVGCIAAGLASAFTFGICGIPIMAGLWKAMRMLQKGETPEMGELFSEFSNMGKWFKLWLVMLLVGIVSGITFGLAGIVVPFLLYFTIPLMLEEDLAAFDAAKKSAKIFTGNFGGLFLPILLAMIVSSLGSIAFGIGILVTAPMMMIAAWSIYDYAVENHQDAASASE